MFLSNREKEMEKQRYMRMLKLLILFICMSVRELYSLTQTIHSLSEEDSFPQIVRRKEVSRRSRHIH